MVYLFNKLALMSLFFLASIVTALADTRDGDKINWELGFGIGGLNVAHYVGANDSRKVMIPIPYVRYQGDFIKADRRGVRGVFWKNEKLEINMSFDLSLPVKSKDNRARVGMPDLELGIEFGPALEYNLYESSNKNQTVVFKLPVRAAFEISDKSPEFYGWITSPRVQLESQFSSWKWRSYVSVEFADQDYQSHFYDVEQPFANNSRQYYKSKSGILNYSIGSSASKRINQWFFGGFINFVNLNISENIDSPLIKTKQNTNVGVFLIWVFK